MDGNVSLKVIYVPTTFAGGIGTLMSGSASGIEVAKFEGRVLLVLSVSTSSTAGATDKIDVTFQHSTSSIGTDAYADLVSFDTNVTGSIQYRMVNSNELSKYGRIKATATGTFVVGLAMVGIMNT